MVGGMNRAATPNRAVSVSGINYYNGPLMVANPTNIYYIWRAPLTHCSLNRLCALLPAAGHLCAAAAWVEGCPCACSSCLG